MLAIILSFLTAGCIGPAPRPKALDEEKQQSAELLKPDVRGPVDAQRSTEDDPADPVLKDDVLQLASDIPLQRVQANNRIKQAGLEGLLAAADFLDDEDATPEQLVEALRLLASADLSEFEPSQVAHTRDQLAVALVHKDSRVRIEAARAMQVHGPGAQRTLFLTAIGDTERRVRWAVVRRFNDHPNELDKEQREILLDYLSAGTREDFETADTDGNNVLSRREFKDTAERFERLAGGDDEISEDEWTSPYSSEIRADVVALLLRLHAKLTPNERPESYNPWLASSDQLDVLAEWQRWNARVADTKTGKDE
ncbi:MAG: hypothetical protein K8I27_09760 [Planctomycetes bacterium]|nr:hypothetical protein [Planctomycetota bacterium]